MSEENKAIVRRFIEEGINKGNLDLMDEVFAPDLVNHSAPPGVPPTLEGFKQSLAMNLSAFPDLHVHLEDEIAEGDRVVVRWTAHGTHKGELMGIPATGKEAILTGMVISRIASGKIVERWEQLDQMGMMVQLGVIQAPGA